MFGIRQTQIRPLLSPAETVEQQTPKDGARAMVLRIEELEERIAPATNLNSSKSNSP